ncbi:protein kinase [Ornithinibacillus salinisoli]|uniref:Protein kinase n=1 Tax=Ornithinibacillus salinisoli TaxID=1848459 RepID=A0ABW4VUC4_9BACI
MEGRYRVLELIGTGSYGMVYHCKDLIENDNKVIKQLRPSKSRNKKEIELFEQEISVMRTLNHNRMPKVYDSFLINNNRFYVMEFIDGFNLNDQIFNQNISYNEKQSLLLILKILELVDELHQSDMYHLDLRLPNIVMKEARPHLIDFGLVKSDPDKRQSRKITHGNSMTLKQQDFFDLGDILLYLLYTTYTKENKKALPWTEELSLENETVYLLKRLLGLNEKYSTSDEIKADIQEALKAISSS